MTIAQRLGYDSDARLLIINADDFGLCPEQNRAVIDGLESKAFTSASVMVPCAGFDAACSYVRSRQGTALGVHLTLTSEWKRLRWGPVADAGRVGSLMDPDGYFWSRRAEVFSFCRADEAGTELRAQVDCTFRAGIDVTHLDSHMFVLHGRRKDLRKVYLDLARDYSLPIRAASSILMHWDSFHCVAEEADRYGILHPDSFALLSRVRPSLLPLFWRSLLKHMPAGVTEVCCHPAYANGSLREFATDADSREADFRFFTSERARQMVAARSIRLVDYRLLRDAMRSSACVGPDERS